MMTKVFSRVSAAKSVASTNLSRLSPHADEGDDLLADLRLFYCDTATFGESAANVQQVCVEACARASGGG